MNLKKLKSSGFVRITLKIIKYITITVFTVSVALFLLLFGEVVWDRLTYEDSSFVKQLKQIDNSDFEYAHKIIDGDWDVICLLSSYDGLTSAHFAKKYSDLSSKIPSLELYSESTWDIVFSNSNHVSYISTKKLSYLYAQYDEFRAETLKKFAKVGFKPQECAEFKDALFFKYTEKSYHSNDVITYITLGELDR